jgi:hypothetical protein
MDGKPRGRRSIFHFPFFIRQLRFFFVSVRVISWIVLHPQKANDPPSHAKQHEASMKYDKWKMIRPQFCNNSPSPRSVGTLQRAML